MYINTANQNFHAVLPEYHWISPVLKVALTPENAADYGYITVYKFFDNEIEKVIETTAQSLGYANAMSARSYAGDVNPFQAQSKQFVRYCGGVWAYAAGEFAKINAGQRVMPTVEQLASELPTFADFEAE